MYGESSVNGLLGNLIHCSLGVGVPVAAHLTVREEKLGTGSLVSWEVGLVKAIGS